jgi:hypothetical protein
LRWERKGKGPRMRWWDLTIRGGGRDSYVKI